MNQAITSNMIPIYIVFPSASAASSTADSDDFIMGVDYSDSGTTDNSNIIEHEDQGEDSQHHQDQDITNEDLQRMVNDIRRNSLEFANQCALSITAPHQRASTSSDAYQPSAIDFSWRWRDPQESGSYSSGLDLSGPLTSTSNMTSLSSARPMIRGYCQECA